MPASPATILAGSNYGATSHLRQIGGAKGYKSQVASIADVVCTIYHEFADKDSVVKAQGIKAGVERVVGCGFTFPDGITFYTASHNSFNSVGFHRTFGGGRKAVVQLGNSSVDTAGMVGKQGIADQVALGNPVKYCEAVVVHELGHNLHERQAEGFFWGSEARDLPPVNIAQQVSQYAASNRLELVAEVFTGLAFDLTYSAAIMNVYGDYHGPV